uniref:DNA-directed RNA polymerase subunit n=1 Tax=Syphacia muris TaxID=451379 RepID=A0A0N5ANU2_9BILA
MDDSEFCSVCGAILPVPVTAPSLVVCALCHSHHTFQPIENRITYRTEKLYGHGLKQALSNSKGEENPIVDKICDKCGYDKMSYACRQTRSADEGQTVYYTCLKCKNSIVENA